MHDRVDALSAAGRGAQDMGRSVQRGFDTAAGAVSGLPVVGGQLSGALSGAGDATGGEAVEAGRAGGQAAHAAARLLGWLTFLLGCGTARSGELTRAPPFDLHCPNPWGA